MIKVVFELLRRYHSRLAQVQVIEGFLDGFPLEFKLVDDLLLNFVEITSPFLVVDSVEEFILGLIIVESRVLLTVVAEVKAFTDVNCVAHPLAEIIIVESALLGRVKIHQDFLEVLVFNLLISLAKVAHDVF